MKWLRIWQMVVQGAHQTWTFGSPFTVRFESVANGTPTPNNADFFIYNLPEKVRNDVLKDIYSGLSDYYPISFAAGYLNEPQAPPIFVGNVHWAYSYKLGPDWVTQFHCVDGGGALEIANCEQSLVSGTALGQVYRVLCQAIVGVGKDVTAFFISSSFDNMKDPRGIVLSGNVWEQLVRRIIPAGSQLFINKGKIYILLQGEYAATPQIVTISEQTGLIGSPRRQSAQTIVTMLFEPRLEVGQIVQLVDASPAAGEHQILNVRHQGMISEAECGNLYTIATLFRPGPLSLPAGSEFSSAGAGELA
jgi:hypothetical protein